MRQRCPPAPPDRRGQDATPLQDHRVPFDAEAGAADPGLFPYRVTPEERSRGPAGLWERCFGPYYEGGLDPFAAEWPAEIAALDGLSLGDFFHRCGLSPEAFEMVADAVQIRPFPHTAFLGQPARGAPRFPGRVLRRRRRQRPDPEADGRPAR